MSDNNIDALLTAVKSHEFQATLNAASGFSMVMRFIQDSEILDKLIQAIIDDESNMDVVVDELRKLLDKQIDSRYEHPDDATITGLLYVLSVVDDIAEIIPYVRNTPNLFWAYNFVSR